MSPSQPPVGKLAFFLSLPLSLKLHYVGTFYYRLKAVLIYRVAFKHFGKGSYIRKPLLIANPRFISIGNKVSIREGARLEVVVSNPNRTPELFVGDNTGIEQNVHIACHSRVHIGSNVSITPNCSIVDVSHPFEDIHDPRRTGLRIKDEDSFVEIGDGAFLGIGCVILPNVRIGKNAVIGANSVVTRDVPDYSVVAGIPAAVIKQYNFQTEKWEKVSPVIATPARMS